MPQADDMIERVAQAAERVEDCKLGKKFRRELGRAVLEAMREPTEGMYIKGLVPIDDAIQSAYDRGRLGREIGKGPWWSLNLQEAWQAMIEEALRGRAS